MANIKSQDISELWHSLCRTWCCWKQVSPAEQETTSAMFSLYVLPRFRNWLAQQPGQLFFLLNGGQARLTHFNFNFILILIEMVVSTFSRKRGKMCFLGKYVPVWQELKLGTLLAFLNNVPNLPSGQGTLLMHSWGHGRQDTASSQLFSDASKVMSGWLLHK